MKRINVTLFDNVNYNEEEYRQDYNENYFADGGTMDFYEWLSDIQQMEWEDFLGNLKYSKNNLDCVIVGSCGTWQGRREIQPIRCKTIKEAIFKCCNSIEYITVKQINGKIEVQACHHDGTNYFTIHLLNDKGIIAGDNANLENRCYHKAIKGYIF